MIIFSLNNETKEISINTLLSDALMQWGFSDKKIAVAINGEFVPRSTYQQREILANDKVDIVTPVGGG